MAGELLARAAHGQVTLPAVLHLLDPVPRTRKSLIADERIRRPGVWVIWLPWLGIKILSALVWMAQKLVRPSQPAIKISSAFAAPLYDTSKITSILRSSDLETALNEGK